MDRPLRRSAELRPRRCGVRRDRQAGPDACWHTRVHAGCPRPAVKPRPGRYATRRASVCPSASAVLGDPLSGNSAAHNRADPWRGHSDRTHASSRAHSGTQNGVRHLPVELLRGIAVSARSGHCNEVAFFAPRTWSVVHPAGEPSVLGLQKLEAQMPPQQAKPPHLLPEMNPRLP